MLATGSIFDGFYSFFGSILAWFYSWAPNYGLAIILLTIAVMIVITPLTLKSTRSMLQLQRLQPELKRIQEKYKGDRERLNAEMMAFYKEHQINPVSGCVPMLAQTPVFLLMYRVIRGITNRNGGAASAIGHVAGQVISNPGNGNFTPWKLTDQPFAPQHLSTSSEMYRALAHTTKMSFLGMDLSISPKDAISIGVSLAIPSLILMALMLGSQIIQNRQIQGRTQNTQVNSQQQAMMKILPFMLPAISFFYPAGLGLYYFVQGLARIGTQSYITRKFYGDDAPGPLVVSASSTEVSTNGSGAASKAAASKPKAPVERKPGASPRSQAAQKKKGPTGTGRRSGEPRGGRPS